MAAIAALVRMINEPEHSRTRTVESISMQGRVIGQQVNMEFHLPAAQNPPNDSGELYVPALIARKQEPIDNLTVFDSQGQTLHILSYDETIKLLAVALNILVTTCAESPGPAGSWVPPVPDRDVRMAESLLLQLIYALKAPEDALIESQIRAAFELLGQAPSTVEGPRFKWLREFVRTLSRAYPVIVALPHDPEVSRAVISYKRTIIQTLDLTWFRGQLRLALGLRPLKVAIGTALAHNSKTYHLQVEAPATQYLMEQTLRCADCCGPLTTRGVDKPGNHPDTGHTHERYLPRGDRPYYELLGKFGQPYAHLYMRGFAATRGESLVLSASFGETPPGTLASATITAAVSCLLIGAIGHSEAAGIGYASDIPPLLLALPAAAASWFGFSSDDDAVLRSSLAARCSLLIGGITSLLGAVVFLVTKRPASAGGGPIPPSVFAMHLPSWWGLLFCIASANALCVFAQLLIRSWSYRRLLLR
jgi:hypothetical protein